MQFLKQFLIFLFLLLMLMACSNDEECRIDKRVNLTIGFYKVSTTANATLVAFTVDSISVKGLTRDSLLYNNVKALKSIQLPLRKFYEQTDFELSVNNVKDTISIFYRNNDAYFLSFACGCIVVHEIDEVTFTQNAIKNIVLQQNIVNNITVEHVKIVL